jgi:hypothetical protein
VEGLSICILPVMDNVPVLAVVDNICISRGSDSCWRCCGCPHGCCYADVADNAHDRA